MPTTITSAGVTFNDTTSLTSANGVPSALKLTTARTINGVSFDGTANITVPASGTSAAKAWVNFDGTGTIGTNQTIRSSYNVSSVTKNATGVYTVNFTSGVLADANYAFSGYSTGISNSQCPGISRRYNTTPTTTSLVIQSGETAPDDSPYIGVIVFGN